MVTCKLTPKFFEEMVSQGLQEEYSRTEKTENVKALRKGIALLPENSEWGCGNVREEDSGRHRLNLGRSFCSSKEFGIFTSQDGGVGRNTLLPPTTKRITTKIKKKKKRTTTRTSRKSFAWKSNNQGVKETFTQTRRRGRYGQRGLGDKAGGSRWARRQLVDQAVPYSHADKPEGTTGEQDRLWNPGFQCWKLKIQNYWI